VSALVDLVVISAPLGALAYGGSTSTISQLDQDLVQDNGFMTEGEFARAYGIATFAPGPNALLLAALGHQVAGISGALVAFFAFIFPGVALGALLIALGGMDKTGPLALVRKAATPAALGALAAAVVTTARVVDHPLGLALAALAFLVLVRTALNPVWVVIATSAVCVLGFGVFGLG
jgi:chromate transporter